jgi:hypothetical protein
MLQTSDQIADIAKALSKAQAKIRHANKGNVNPHFKSKYADLAAIIDEIRGPFTENGLSFVQGLGNDGPTITCTTLLMHESGQWIRSQFGLTPQQSTPQSAGSCATYLKRYSIQSIAGVGADEDDDGNAASGTNSGRPTSTSAQADSKTKGPTNTVVPAKTTAPANPATAIETFSLTNVEHVKKLTVYLQGKGQVKLIEALCKRMNGKQYTAASVEKEWQAINPEAPDRDPEDDK